MNANRPTVRIQLLPEHPGIEGQVRLSDGLRRRSVHIVRGERIAQFVFARFERPTTEIMARIDNDTARGVGGFGSTGVE